MCCQRRKYVYVAVLPQRTKSCYVNWCLNRAIVMLIWIIHPHQLLILMFQASNFILYVPKLTLVCRRPRTVEVPRTSTVKFSVEWFNIWYFNITQSVLTRFRASSPVLVLFCLFTFDCILSVARGFCLSSRDVIRSTARGLYCISTGDLIVYRQGIL